MEHSQNHNSVCNIEHSEMHNSRKEPEDKQEQSLTNSSEAAPGHSTDQDRNQQSILDRIVAATRARVEQRKEAHALEQVISQLYRGEQLKQFTDRPCFAFESALRKKGMSFICEVKKASPSKGMIAEHFPYIAIAREYEEAGADAISVLTEQDFFLGKAEYLTEISRTVSIPVLRKDFIIDEYQIYEAKLIGADAVLLICSLLQEERLRYFLKLTKILGLSALVETHTTEEVGMALRAGASIIGVNNRNLQNFTVNLSTSIELRKQVPEELLFVAESGIDTPEDIRLLKEAGTDAVLIGEALMRSSNKKQLLSELREGLRG